MAPECTEITNMAAFTAMFPISPRVRWNAYRYQMARELHMIHTSVDGNQQQEPRLALSLQVWACIVPPANKPDALGHL